MSDSRPTSEWNDADDSDLVLYENSNGVARITLNRPSKRNAMTFRMLQLVRRYLAVAKGDSQVHVVVVQGTGDLAFCSGMDLSAVGGENAALPAVQKVRLEVAGLCVDLWELGKPTIARVQGWAVGGGFGLALACDLIVASERAKFGAPEINVGLWPQVIAVPMMRAMPRRTALDLMITGRMVDGPEGERIGFVNRLVTHESLDSVVDEIAASLASKSPEVMKLGRDSFYSLWDMGTADALEEMKKDLGVKDSAEGIAAFLGRRPANWSNT